MANPKFTNLLKLMQETHDRKMHDYAGTENPYSNFEFAAQYAGVSVDVVFDVLQGIKQARLLQLRRKQAKNEPKEDSYLDKANYAALQASYHGVGSKPYAATGPQVAVSDLPGVAAGATAEALQPMLPPQRGLTGEGVRCNGCNYPAEGWWGGRPLCGACHFRLINGRK